MEIVLFKTAKESHKVIHAAIGVKSGDRPEPLVGVPAALLENSVGSLHDIVIVPLLLRRLLALLLLYRKPCSLGLLFDQLLLWSSFRRLISLFSSSNFLSLALPFLRL